MWFAVFNVVHKGSFRHRALLQRVKHIMTNTGFSTIDDVHMSSGKTALATNLASLLEESYEAEEREKRSRSRMELKRYLENRIKKRVKEQYVNGKFRDLMEKVIANPETLQDAYDCIRLNANIDISANDDKVSYESMSQEICSGDFDVKANTFHLLIRGSMKDILVLPNLKLKVLQEAMKVVLEVVYRPHFSKISHGCRSGRGHVSALKFIKKDLPVSDWWFTVHVNKKIDGCILDKLISVMEEKIEDQRLFSIIQTMFATQVLNLEFGGYPKGHGLPQEGVLSSILMNIYLDLFDREFYRLSMKYAALDSDSQPKGNAQSKLRTWFRRNLKANDVSEAREKNSSSRVHSCRFMDEMFFAVAGPEDVALSFKSEIVSYLKESLHLEVDDKTELLPCKGPTVIRVMGTLVRRTVEESPAMKAVHKLKEKVELFALQKQEAWDIGTIRIGKKWIAHGLKKVKESEIKHLADPESTLSRISYLRKPGMKTDHWYKHLLKIWMIDIRAKEAESEESLLSEYVSEPALPKELTDSFHEFQKCAREYVTSETASTNALLKSSNDSIEKPVLITQTIAPTEAIKKRLFRYGLSTTRGFPRACSRLISQDDDQIVDWFSGVVRRWFKWYGDCDNFSDIKLLICDHIRMSCIRTLASKHRIHESLIENKFDTELSRIPSHEDLELEIADEASDVFENDEALMYGISYSGLCLMSMARTASQAQDRNCYVFGCVAKAGPSVYTLHVMERQRFPGWKTGFSSCIHLSLKGRKLRMCKQHVKDLYLGLISLQSVNFGSRK